MVKKSQSEFNKKKMQTSMYWKQTAQQELLHEEEM